MRKISGKFLFSSFFDFSSQHHGSGQWEWTEMRRGWWNAGSPWMAAADLGSFGKIPLLYTRNCFQWGTLFPRWVISGADDHFVKRNLKLPHLPSLRMALLCFLCVIFEFISLLDGGWFCCSQAVFLFFSLLPSWPLLPAFICFSFNSFLPRGNNNFFSMIKATTELWRVAFLTLI